MSADPSGVVRITSSPKNGPETTTTLEADLIVGADGVGSAVRNTGGFHSRASAGSGYVRTIVAGQTRPGFEEYWTPLGSFGLAPLRGDSIYFWAAADAPAVAEAVSRRDLPSFQREWRRVLPIAADLLEKVPSFEDLLVNTVHRVDCRRWFSGRLVLLGDAAHAMAPNLGQGANSALVDTVVLAEELTTAPSIEEALVRYDQQRRPTVRRVQNIAGMLQRLCGLESTAALGIRDALLVGLGRLPGLSERSIRRTLAHDVRSRQVSIPLRQSALNLTQKPPAETADCRPPNAHQPPTPRPGGGRLVHSRRDQGWSSRQHRMPGAANRTDLDVGEPRPRHRLGHFLGKDARRRPTACYAAATTSPRSRRRQH